ncbi:MAG: MBOAT family protein [Desulfobacterales bacterium]
MVFSSIIFLFLFLPVTLFVYLVIGRRLRNYFLLFASLVFYAWGETAYVLIMLLSIAANYVAGLTIDHFKDRPQARLFLGLAVAFNIGLLSVFKYANFIADNLNILLGSFELPTVALQPVHLPIGISFFTFQAMSYVIDIYRRDAVVQRNPADIGLYIALFPQLIAGPIVRFHDIAAQITHRRVRIQDFAEGVERFIIGLGKKVLIANQVAVISDQVFALKAGALSPGIAWLGVLCYALQIYFDFSGYSDMAIGLGRMFGFRFLENFNYPYISKSVREFWRRWHISLSSWFRDYLYVPLGGNRQGALRTHFNLLTVFFLCGLWHGASWNFVVWGLLHGLFLIIERLGFEKILVRLWAPLRHFYLLSVVMITWVFFRVDTLSAALGYLAVMFGQANGGTTPVALMHIGRDAQTAIIAGIIFSAPVFSWLNRFRQSVLSHRHRKMSMVFDGTAGAVKTVGLSLILYVSILFISSGAYNPFIYFRF